MGFYHMMTGSGDWVMWVQYVGMAAFWIAAAAALTAVIAADRRRRSRTPDAPHERALDVLERRYAAGEIETAEFLRVRLDLAGHPAPVASDGQPALHLLTQTRSGREISDLDWGPRPVA